MYRIYGYTEVDWLNDINLLLQKDIFTLVEILIINEQLTFCPNLSDHGFDQWLNFTNNQATEERFFPLDCD